MAEYGDRAVLNAVEHVARLAGDRAAPPELSTVGARNEGDPMAASLVNG
jgi:hypothetical protein